MRLVTSQRLGWAAAVLVTFCVLALVRLRTATELGADWSRAVELYILIGFAYDGAISCLCAAVALLVPAKAASYRGWVWGFCTFIAVGTAYASLLHIRFFGSRLEYWVITTHLADLWQIRAAVAATAQATPFLTAVMLVAAAGLIGSLAWLPFRRARATQPRGASGRAALLLGAAGVVLAGVARSAEPPRFHGGTILSDHVLISWLRLSTQRPTSDVHLKRDFVDRVEMLSADGVPAAAAVLARYADSAPPSRAEFPLVRPLQPDRKRTLQLRAELGLSVEKQPNVIVLFLETTRAYEAQHPEIGPLIFPNLRQVMAEHGIQFTQAYSSALGPGRTVNGQFGTLCSMLPNFLGAAAYIGYPGLQIACAQEIARANGYQTLWISGGYKDFNGKFMFESLHGMDEFFDLSYFEVHGRVDEPPQACGYPDKALLQELVLLLEQKQKSGKPVFINALTITGHDPHHYIPSAPVPEALARDISSTAYLNYLSTMRYTDQSLGIFFEKLFKSPAGDNTVVVVLGDHGARHQPNRSMLPEAWPELVARVPMAIISKNLKRARVIEYPVNQVDVAPTLAAIAGWSGETAWLGRDMLAGPGTPWVFGSGDVLFYRSGDRACYTALPSQEIACYSFPAGTDPLYAASAEPLPRDNSQEAFFRSVVTATSDAIRGNLIAPRKGIGS